MKKTLVRTWPLAVMILAVVLWYWPATLMGQVPGEGMVALGDLPLFSFLGRAFESGRVPLWNELAGFGSPVLAEGQLGVLYPPHRLLFGLFEAPTAFVVSLVLHTVLAGSLTYCCARGLGQSRAASLMAGLIFCGQGFFMSRTDFVWASTTACWLPLAVLATWKWMQDGGWVWPESWASNCWPVTSRWPSSHWCSCWSSLRFSEYETSRQPRANSGHRPAVADWCCWRSPAESSSRQPSWHRPRNC